MTKRLEIVLPKNHKIFSYPRGSRSVTAATLLDIGIKLSDIESRLDNIEKRISGLSVVEVPKEPTQNKSQIAHNIIQGFGID